MLWSITTNQKFGYDSDATFLFLLYPLDLHGTIGQVPWVHACHTSCIGNGISIVIPISGILEWIRYQSMGGHKVTIELPLNWYENNYNEPEKAFLFKTIHPSQER